ncbi:MAG TPA: acetyl-CoA carboxylase biotin carboxyl carrier protein subunit [Terriglobales bacterium]|nr:acetyl-CoA carboxylase biotin carboxyl carrier protein subunit [Terriglobales bacterium]
MNNVSETRNTELTEHRARARMSLRNRITFFVVAWAIVLLPFLFWRSTWFGRPLNDADLNRYLHDDAKPRNIQYALVQVNERISRHDAGVAQWYPDLVRLSSYPVEEIRNTDAWVMGQDSSRPEFHQALLQMLHDSSALVRGNAALALVRFGDHSGHDEIVQMLQLATMTAPQAGKVVDEARPGTAIRKGGVVLRMEVNGQEVELRSPLTGRVHEMLVKVNDSVVAGKPLATVAPGEDQVWEALRGLYIIGTRADLETVSQYLRPSDDLPDRVRQQAAMTRDAIQQRNK